MILVDTSVLIDLFKGDDNEAVSDFREIIQQQVPFGICSVIYHIRRFCRGQEQRKNMLL
jgi:predicted nucleic acid-binding protein